MSHRLVNLHGHTLGASRVNWPGSPPPADPPTVSDPGFTTHTPSVDTVIIYVSNSDGDDANDGLSEGAAKKTIAAGIALLTDGNPDWLLLKRGDTWTDEAFGIWVLSGRSLTERMVISSYGTSTVRPLLKTGILGGLSTTGGGGRPLSENFLVLKGIHFYAHTRDPDSVDFIDANGGKGISILMGVNGWLFENNRFDFYKDNFNLHDTVESQEIKNVTIRYNVFTNNYSTDSHSQGLFVDDTDSNVLIEHNIFDHCGWNETVAGATATIFNHNIYLQQTNSPDITVRNNIIMRASSHGIQHRAGGDLHDNLFVECPLAILIGEGASAPEFSVLNNVILDGNDITASLPRGHGMDFNATNNTLCQDNIMAHVSGGDPRGIRGINSGTISQVNNIIHDWGVFDTGASEDYVDPDRTIESYSTSVGGAGTRADFFDQVRAQSFFTWNEDYSEANIRQYFIDGFVLV